jgi:hypothetical protein
MGYSYSIATQFIATGISVPEGAVPTRWLRYSTVVFASRKTARVGQAALRREIRIGNAVGAAFTSRKVL